MYKITIILLLFMASVACHAQVKQPMDSNLKEVVIQKGTPIGQGYDLPIIIIGQDFAKGYQKPLTITRGTIFKVDADDGALLINHNRYAFYLRLHRLMKNKDFQRGMNPQSLLMVESALAEQDSMLEKLDATTMDIRETTQNFQENYEQAMANMESALSVSEKTLALMTDNANKLQKDLDKITKQHRRRGNWNKFLAGTTVVSVGVATLIILK